MALSSRKFQADPNALKREIAALTYLSTADLRTKWRKLFRSNAPTHLPRYLLLSVVVYRIQANALGDLDSASIRYLDQIADDRKSRIASKPKAPPPIPPVPQNRSLKPGTIVAREHEGKMHKVIVLENGYSWNEKTYRSLSEAAFAITGTKWNGPRFFGLRDGPQPPVKTASTALGS